MFLGWAVEDEGVGLRTLLAGGLILVAVALIASPAKGRVQEATVVVPARGR